MRANLGEKQCGVKTNRRTRQMGTFSQSARVFWGLSLLHLKVCTFPIYVREHKKCHLLATQFHLTMEMGEKFVLMRWLQPYLRKKYCCANSTTTSPHRGAASEVYRVVAEAPPIITTTLATHNAKRTRFSNFRGWVQCVWLWHSSGFRKPPGMQMYKRGTTEGVCVCSLPKLNRKWGITGKIT